MKDVMSEVSMVVDPVCGMRIDRENAVGSSQWDGQTVYFCSRGCETSFDTSPRRYFEGQTVQGSCCSAGHSCH